MLLAGDALPGLLTNTVTSPAADAFHGVKPTSIAPPSARTT